MVVIAKTIFMRDLRGNWVFPRLVYTATGLAIDRGIRRLFRFLIRRPFNRAREFFAVLRDHESIAEILLAGFAVFVSFIRALALLLLALGSFYIAIARF